METWEAQSQDAEEQRYWDDERAREESYYCQCVKENDLVHTDKCPVHHDSPDVVKPHTYGGREDSHSCYYCGFPRDSEVHRICKYPDAHKNICTCFDVDIRRSDIMEGQFDRLEGKKHDGGKPPMALLSSDALFEIAKVLEFGAKKYDAWNWKGGFKWVRISSAVLRHIFSWLKGEDKDPETGLSHLAHASCGLMFLLDFEVNHLGEDDRYKKAK